ncbi:MAG TPA: SDR family NAD(P)-dependent oxidoreductase [Thermoanaerobaculia bacterium]|nr:SDR family NAD(P)-dependent oxidoreductase [Thermoanaerobaculia bacterium]HQN07258.1 SDR family NAD(P)-dependent oxidoreductase [Thermoanaerobaculia bacterium]HQP87492.1 SDR family NAD(P)-dependent oxidoreductase [Thermoanaerobaculia bacterium]
MPAVLITGAGKGFGRAMLEEYLRRGWTAYPVVRDSRVAASLEGSGCRPIVADVVASDAEGLIAATLDAYGDPLDLLVNNAGIIRKARGLAAAEPEDLESHFHVHCLGALRCTRAARPWLRRAERPLVVNVTSRFGSIGQTAAGGFRGIYAYNVAKAAQNMLTACLDQELRDERIRVVAVHPGRLRTTVGAADADTEPAVAARALADWVDRLDRDAPCACWDLMRGGVIEW